MTRHDYQDMSAGYEAPAIERTYLVRFPWAGREIAVSGTSRDDAARKAQDAIAATGLEHRTALALYSTKVAR